jgi:hypothetical protein
MALYGYYTSEASTFARGVTHANAKSLATRKDPASTRNFA